MYTSTYLSFIKTKICNFLFQELLTYMNCFSTLSFLLYGGKILKINAVIYILHSDVLNSIIYQTALL